MVKVCEICGLDLQCEMVERYEVRGDIILKNIEEFIEKFNFIKNVILISSGPSYTLFWE